MNIDLTIQKLQELSEKDITGYNETEVREKVVIEILKILGLFDDTRMEVYKDNLRPDYVIKDGKTIVIEVKGTQEILLNHLTQIDGYSYKFRSIISVLTNGLYFYFFSPFWARNSFEESLILSFSIEELCDENIATKLISLMSFKEVEKFQQEIERINDKINVLDDEKIEIIKLNPNIQEYIDLETTIRIAKVEMLKESYQNLINSYFAKEDEAKKLQEEKDLLEQKLPSFLENIIPNMGIEPPKKKKKTGVRKNKQEQYGDIKNPDDDFVKGRSNEVININALIAGVQIVYCKDHELNNNKIFIVHKSTTNSEFIPSSFGKDYLSPYSNEFTEHIAIVECFKIPGKNRDFWQEMYDNKEFFTWDIDEGPYKYFKEKSRDAYFWFFQVYKLNFKLMKDIDYSSGAMDNYNLIKQDTLNEITNGFKINLFKPVISQSEYQKRRDNILKIINKDKYKKHLT